MIFNSLSLSLKEFLQKLPTNSRQAVSSWDKSQMSNLSVFSILIHRYFSLIEFIISLGSVANNGQQVRKWISSLITRSFFFCKTSSISLLLVYFYCYISRFQYVNHARLDVIWQSNNAYWNQKRYRDRFRIWMCFWKKRMFWLSYPLPCAGEDYPWLKIENNYEPWFLSCWHCLKNGT